MRREAAVRIHLVRGEGEHSLIHLRIRQPFQSGQEEARVGGHPLDVRVGLDHHQHAVPRRRGRRVEGFGRWREARDTRPTRTKPDAAGRGFQQ